MKLARYTTLAKGHYRLMVDAAGIAGPCSYRVYAQTHYEAFLATTNALTTDRYYFQPIVDYELHLVGAVTFVDYPDPENLFAEVVIWREKDDTMGSDRREVLYASSGSFRDDCKFF